MAGQAPMPARREKDGLLFHSERSLNSSPHVTVRRGLAAMRARLPAPSPRGAYFPIDPIRPFRPRFSGVTRTRPRQWAWPFGNRFAI